MITGRTRLIVHLGYPTESFKAPMIYNPWFEMKGINAVVVPVGVQPPQYSAIAESAVQYHERARCTRHHAAQGHDHAVGGRDDDHGEDRRRLQRDPAPIRRTLLGDMFDGAGFVRGVERKGTRIAGARALVVGCGGVGSAIAASLAAAGALADWIIRSGHCVGGGVG